MRTGVDGEVGVPVRINGKDASLGIDTGSLLSSVSIPLVNELKLDHIEMKHGELGEYFGGVKIRYLVQVKEIQIGHTMGRDAAFFAEPTDISDYDDDGLLGPDVLHQYDVEFDFAGGKFNMFLPSPCPGNVVYWTRTGYAVVPMKVDDSWQIRVSVALDGKPFEAIIDSGSYRSMLTMEAAKELFGLDEKSPGMKSLGDLQLNHQSGSTTYLFPFRAMNFGGVTVNNPDILLVPKAQMVGGPAGLIGISILRQLHLYIAYKEQKLYVTPAQVIEPPATPLPAPTPSTPGHAPASAPPRPAPTKSPATAPIASATSTAKQN